MSHMLPLLPAIGCVAMMFSAGALARLVSNTSLAHAIRSRRRAVARHFRGDGRRKDPVA